MRSRIMSHALLFVGVLGMACSVVAGLHAQAVVAPEIDSGSLVTGLTLASAAALMLRARWRSK